MALRAHLNGGPHDDRYVSVNSDRYRVARSVDLSRALTEPEPSAAASLRVGMYVMRCDVFGHPVPHDLAGVIEFDWRGWE